MGEESGRGRIATGSGQEVQGCQAPEARVGVCTVLPLGRTSQLCSLWASLNITHYILSGIEWAAPAADGLEAGH